VRFAEAMSMTGGDMDASAGTKVILPDPPGTSIEVVKPPLWAVLGVIIGLLVSLMWSAFLVWGRGKILNVW
jgi:hypothetical protein